MFFEMLSGKRVFDGEDVSEILAAVLRADPDWSALPAETPAGIRTLIKRCLERDRKARIPEIGTVRFLLQDTLSAPVAADSSTVVAPPPRPLWKRVWPAAAAALVASALVGAAVWSLRPAPSRPVSRFIMPLPEGAGFTALGRHMVAISRDGTRVAFVASSQLYLRSTVEFDPKPIAVANLTAGVAEPVFSPDGKSIAFFVPAEDAIKRVSITGGPASTVCSASNLVGMTWGGDGILFAHADGSAILRVASSGGTPATLISFQGDERAHGPQMLPGGEAVLFTSTKAKGTDRWDNADIVVQSLKTGERKQLVAGATDARYVPTGHIVYAVGGTLFAVGFDVRRLELTGEPIPVVEGVRRAPGGISGAAHYAVSDSGSLVYVPGPASNGFTQMDVVLSDRKGTRETLKIPPGPYGSLRMSPDGKRIAFDTVDSKEAIVWTYDLSGTSAMQRLTFAGNNRSPIWSADGKRLTFQSDRDGDRGIFWQLADGTGPVERLTRPGSGESHEPLSWSSANNVLLFDVRQGNDVTLWTLALPDKKIAPFGDVHSMNNPTSAVFSPDGRWVAYTSTTGPAKTTVYVQPFPATGAKYEIPTTAGAVPHEPTWSRDGKELFYNPRPSGFEAVSVTTQPTFAFGNPVAMSKPFTMGPPSARRNYDVAPDGRFLGVAPEGATGPLGANASQAVYIVLNWFEELKQRVPR